jgi:hypothetical protein
LVLESVSRRLVLVSRSRVGNRFGGSRSCNGARTCTYRLVGPLACAYARIRARPAVRAYSHTYVRGSRLREEDPPTERIIQPRYWSKYSVAFTYES